MESEERSPWDDDPHLHTNLTNRTALDYLSIATDYFTIPLSFTAVAADVILLVIILKYKRLRSRTNFYMINFAICHIIYIVSTPVLFDIIADVFFRGHMEVRWYCVWIRIENFAMGNAFTFIAGFGIDSFLKKVKPAWFSKYKLRYPYVFASIYFGHFLIYIISSCICFKKGFNNNFNFYFLTAYFFLVLICILYITFRERKMERNLKLSTPCKAYALTISTIVLLTWLPLIVYYNLIIVSEGIENVENVLWYVIFLPEYLVYSCPLIVIYKLWKSSKYFKIAFRKVFRMKVPDFHYDELNTRDNQE